MAIGLSFIACDSDDDSDIKAIVQWRNANNAWLADMQALKNSDGTPYYNMIVPRWDPSSFVLIHYFNERTTDPNALKPLYTSTVDVRSIFIFTTILHAIRRRCSPKTAPGSFVRNSTL